MLLELLFTLFYVLSSFTIVVERHDDYDLYAVTYDTSPYESCATVLLLPDEHDPYWGLATSCVGS